LIASQRSHGGAGGKGTNGGERGKAEDRKEDLPEHAKWLLQFKLMCERQKLSQVFVTEHLNFHNEMYPETCLPKDYRTLNKRADEYMEQVRPSLGAGTSAFMRKTTKILIINLLTDLDIGPITPPVGSALERKFTVEVRYVPSVPSLLLLSLPSYRPRPTPPPGEVGSNTYKSTTLSSSPPSPPPSFLPLMWAPPDAASGDSRQQHQQ
jgi:hypothetical protein